MPLAAVRGATTVDADTREQIISRTQELVGEILTRNALDADVLVSMLFTATPDISAEFPAVAVRELGIVDVPLMCAAELSISGAMAHCIRVMVHVDTDRDRRSFRHVYLHGAVALRPDLEHAPPAGDGSAP